ncbi:unnamed protein product [Gemmata massiliana]|uniref:Uncharacterized protein n=1 Tax=Gemmata massiliana TaxID=1210884 RepID=A0A6P2CSL9_9BACT|nr:hypothetical protein [Gemmata massiliana]VTR91607.1 unnamed protein product [Gemmata massiliana]
MFTEPVFTARTVAKALGLRLGRTLTFAEGDEDVDGEVEVTDRVHVQVGADYLAVGMCVDEATLRVWPSRRDLPWAFHDLQEVLQQAALLPESERPVNDD